MISAATFLALRYDLIVSQPHECSKNDYKQQTLLGLRLRYVTCGGVVHSRRY